MVASEAGAGISVAFLAVASEIVVFLWVVCRACASLDSYCGRDCDVRQDRVVGVRLRDDFVPGVDSTLPLVLRCFFCGVFVTGCGLCRVGSFIRAEWACSVDIFAVCLFCFLSNSLVCFCIVGVF